MSNPTLHFITGGGMTDVQQAVLCDSIQAWYRSRISFAFDVRFYKYTDNVAALLQADFPAGPIVLAGHSFGGCRAVHTAQALATVRRVVDAMFLFDPVEIDREQTPNVAGFVLPTTVTQALCFTRKIQAVPFSGRITSGPLYRNFEYTAKSADVLTAHGECVWDTTNIAMVSSALQGRVIIPSPPPPPPRRVVSVVVTYDSGDSVTL